MSEAEDMEQVAMDAHCPLQTAESRAGDETVVSMNNIRGEAYELR